MRNFEFSKLNKFGMIRKLILIFALIVAPVCLAADDPTATHYDINQCLGSQRPYPDIDDTLCQYPDSLTPVFINHVGRHGARYPSSAKNYQALNQALMRADSAGTITPKGRRLLQITDYVIETAHNRWGALDSLGMAEQRGIAWRMFKTFPKLFDGTTVNAISSYSPRCVMSMYEFCHQLDRLNNNIDIITSSGRVNSPLMRPFDLDRDYIDFIKQRRWQPPYELYMRTTVPPAAIHALIGHPDWLDRDEAQELAMNLYGVLAGWQAMGLDLDPADFVSREHLNALWSVFNLRQYLQRTATTISAVPADVASALLLDLIATTDAAVDGTAVATVRLRFGHAETLMPLLSLMRVRGSAYLTNYFDTVGMHWRDFDIVPMAANIRLILFRSPKGKYYVRLDHNEVPVPLLPDSDAIYVPWAKARAYLMNCVPLYLQP